MSNALTTYTFPASTGSKAIRVVEIEGNPWFVAADVCRSLGLTNTTMAMKGLRDDEKGLNKVETRGGGQYLNVVSESGLYRVAVRSNSPDARPPLNSCRI